MGFSSCLGGGSGSFIGGAGIGIGAVVGAGGGVGGGVGICVGEDGGSAGLDAGVPHPNRVNTMQSDIMIRELRFFICATIIVPYRYTVNTQIV